MPNICTTRYLITGNEADRKSFVAMLDHLKSLPEPLVKNGWGRLWMGCLITYLSGSWEAVYCRGNIEDYSADFGVISLHVESAWGELQETRAFLKAKFPGLTFYYQAEECGNLYFVTNSFEQFPEKYILDYCQDSKGKFYWEYFTTLEAAADFVSNNCLEGVPVEATKTGINTALDQYQEAHPDDVSFVFEEFMLIND